MSLKQVRSVGNVSTSQTTVNGTSNCKLNSTQLDFQFEFTEKHERPQTNLDLE